MTNLSMVAAVIDVARARPARPLKEFFQRPQMPIREMYLYRFLVNLTWYARNYMNIVLIYIFVSALFYPLFLLNLASAGLLHFVCVGLRESPKDAKKTLPTTDPSQPAVGGDTNSISASSKHPMAQSSKIALTAMSRSIVKGLHETADNFLKAASGRELDTPVSPSKDGSSPDSRVGSPIGGPPPTDPKFTSKVIDGTAMATFTEPQGMMVKGSEEEVTQRQVPKLQMSELHKLEIAESPAQHHHHKKSHHHALKKHTRRSIVFKCVQLLCCCVVFWTYGVGVCFVATLIPVFIICLHAVLTPYGDEASEFFESAARSRGTEIEAPSTPVQAFQGKQETSFSATREKFEKQVARPPTMNLPPSESPFDGHLTPTGTNDGSDSPLKAVLHAHSAADLFHPRSQNTNKGSGYPRVVISDDADGYHRASSHSRPSHLSIRTARKSLTGPLTGTPTPNSLGLGNVAFPMSFRRSPNSTVGGGGNSGGVSSSLGLLSNSSSPTAQAAPPFSMEPRSIS